MFDARIRPLIDPPLARAGRRLAAAGVTADGLTLAGFGVGMLATAAIAAGWFAAGFVLIAINRLVDGLDGPVARATTASDRGGFLDIVLDFGFYGAIPLAFAIADPAANALAAAALLTAFYVNGAAFLAFAVMAEKRGLATEAQGRKSLYYVAGLAEGTETVAVFLAMAAFPGWFPVLAWGFAALTAVSAAARIVIGAARLKAPPAGERADR
ncbi:CDP-alcohol phosphatidyltransferase family protein [Methylobrevis albus]|uniref:CDP-alcohol phosphatidyltransferase family protein n=1 Tax=Methylobrevis albus TaxID=2793297 RepID=A0A931HZK2_9HYPH|nr:CDP-alcohol phosphatidyltransferase family protein [Methylobrevis albus]MBH0236263.1 CDP-alcohol phosphatidyltransferase family protein [Methylobrevis albus]